MSDALPMPYPWMGGKSAIAARVWQALGGDCRNYVEPFLGGGAMLLARPEPFEGVETVNDVNAHISNFWRAVQAEPDAVAEHCDQPVSELDLHAWGNAIFYPERHPVGIVPGNDYAAWVERQRHDPTYYDVRIAGRWAWGQSIWIGDNWGRVEHNAKKVNGVAVGVVEAAPDMYSSKGIARRSHRVEQNLPDCGHAGKGLARASMHRKMPAIGNVIEGRCGVATSGAEVGGVRAYLAALSARIRRVRVCCGDWSRVMGPSVLYGPGTPCAVFLDPPYASTDRDSVYGEYEDFDVAHDVRAWCLANGADARLRIVLAGYAGEHDDLVAAGWQCLAWKAKGGYGNQSADGNANRHRERLWLSPHCRHEEDLFATTPTTTREPA